MSYYFFPKSTFFKNSEAFSFNILLIKFFHYKAEKLLKHSNSDELEFTPVTA